MAAFVGQIVVRQYQIGRTGFGPSWFVSFGGGGVLEQFALGPHPKFRRAPARSGRRLISSLQFGPFSVTYGRCVTGWKARPNVFRCPEAERGESRLALAGDGVAEG